ncbi:hypothetical protein KO506_06545 [Polaribacter vadi]|uniref:glycine-rich domain-containing protein n=1 Tax=Polaribacter TaxID=52959 RepID=UPI001C09F697|nr:MULTISPECIES: hypothetical protein [Polaribacter]MBU3011054.1 hypothetical protein [Polaribacter vadi]MDO6740868.1 hypothetical protein [Polaribacter sp. 1_MG-2023]
MKNEKLWIKIKNFNLDDESSDFPFSKRLARDNNWEIKFALKSILEYKKFIYLCCVSNKQITPSDAVDQVWHLHLTYTKSYWKTFCNETLGKEIHHNPTKGGTNEREKFSDCYDSTFEIYKSEFKETPPNSIWLNNKKRFKEVNFKRINIDSFWLIKKPSKQFLFAFKLLTILLIIPLLFIRAKDSLTDSSSIIIVLVVVIILITLKSKNNNNNNGCSYDDFHDDGCDSGCSGCSGCGD